MYSWHWTRLPGITGELPLAFQVDTCLAIQKAELRDVDRRAPRAGGWGGLEQGQMGNWPTLDDDCGGR
jgi:hypothetical protein